MVGSDQISNSFETLWFSLLSAKMKIIQAFMHVLVICKNEDDSIKNKKLERLQHFPIISLCGFFPDAQGQLTPQSLVLDFMFVIVTCKNEEHSIINKGAEVFITLYIKF